jgi:hypothetical protein
MHQHYPLRQADCANRPALRHRHGFNAQNRLERDGANAFAINAEKKMNRAKGRPLRGAIYGCWVLLGCNSLIGCVNLAVYPMKPQADNPPLVGDLAYYLPRTAITLTGTTTIKKCNAAPVTKATFAPDIEVTTTLTPLQSTEPDPDAHYYVSYEKSRTWMKEINFSVANTPSGMLQTFNSTINDQVGADVVAAVGTVVQIGGAVATGGVTAPGLLRIKVDVEPPAYCSPEVIAGLKEVETQSASLKRAQAEQPHDAAGLAAQTLEIQTAQGAIDGATKKYKLTRSFSFKWVPKLADLKADAFPNRFIATEVDVSPVIRDWFSNAGQAWLDQLLKSGDSRQSPVTSPFLITLGVDARSMGNPSPPIADYSKSLGGLVLRDPAKATLRVCRVLDPDCLVNAAAIPENMLSETTNDIGARLAVVLPQFGRTMVLPEHSGLFDNATLTATLNADGSISTIGYHAVSTAAAGLTGIGSAAGGVTSGVAARNTAIGAYNTAAAAQTTANINQIQGPDVYNKALADCLAQQKAILAAGGTPGACN